MTIGSLIFDKGEISAVTGVIPIVNCKLINYEQSNLQTQKKPE
jgi:hypothetical protein